MKDSLLIFSAVVILGTAFVAALMSYNGTVPTYSGAVLGAFSDLSIEGITENFNNRSYPYPYPTPVTTKQ